MLGRQSNVGRSTLGVWSPRKAHAVGGVLQCEGRGFVGRPDVGMKGSGRRRSAQECASYREESECAAYGYARFGLAG